jgi:hypothetical protein
MLAGVLPVFEQAAVDVIPYFCYLRVALVLK